MTTALPTYEDLAVQLSERLGVPVTPGLLTHFEENGYDGTDKTKIIAPGLQGYIGLQDGYRVPKSRGWVICRMETNETQRNFDERAGDKPVILAATPELAQRQERDFLVSTLQEAVRSALAGLLNLNPNAHAQDMPM